MPLPGADSSADRLILAPGDERRHTALGAGGYDRGWRRLAPGLAALLGYRRSWLAGDLLAGVTVAAYLVPQVMAYADVARLHRS